MSPENNSSEVNESVQVFTRQELREMREQALAMADQEQGEASAEVQSEGYDHLFSPDYEAPTNVEDAAVRPVETEEERMTRERKVDDAKQLVADAYKRLEMQ